MIVTSTPDVPGKEITEILGIVRGNSVKAKNIGRDITAAFKNLVGGEISQYSKLMTETRDTAYNLMMEEAHNLGADAVVNLRFTTSNVMQNAAEILAYGTAVKLR